MGIIVMSLGERGRKKPRIACPFYPGAGKFLQRVPKRLGSVDSENL
jgi:hypothetical protein